VFHYRLKKNIEDSLELLNLISHKNLDKWNDKIRLLRDINKMRISLKQLKRLNFETNEKEWCKKLIGNFKRLFNFIIECITVYKLGGSLTQDFLTMKNE